MISLCVIARQEAHCIGRMLESVQGVVSEIVVVDTGSTDGTQEIAVQYGAQLVECAWPGDFSVARNLSLSHARCPWILVLDSDEELGPGAREAIHTAIAGELRGVFLYRHHYLPTTDCFHASIIPEGHYARARGAQSLFVTHDVRLFPNHSKVRFQGAVHESVEESIYRSGFSCERGQAIIDHYGPLLPLASRQAKQRLYLELAEQKVLEHPHDWRTWYHLGAELQSSGRHWEAISRFQHGLALCPSFSPMWRQLGVSLCANGELGACIDVVLKALSIEPACVVSWNLMGLALTQLERHQEAEQCFTMALSLDPSNPVASASLATLRERVTERA